MVLPALLQKPSKTSKAKDHSNKLEIRFQLRKDRNILDLPREGRTIQERLRNSKSENERDKPRIFSNLMIQGKINAAVKMLSNSNIGIHSVDDNVLEELQNKHPDPSLIKKGTLLHGPINRVLPSYFGSIDKTMVLKAESLTKGAEGHSQLESEQYRHTLNSSKFKIKKTKN